MLSICLLPVSLSRAADSKHRLQPDLGMSVCVCVCLCVCVCVCVCLGEACWWTIHPASKQRSEGEKVRVGDDLILVSVSSERYLVSGQGPVAGAPLVRSHRTEVVLIGASDETDEACCTSLKSNDFLIEKVVCRLCFIISS